VVPDWFNVVDDFNREALAIEVDFSLTAERVVRVLEAAQQSIKNGGQVRSVGRSRQNAFSL